MAGQLTEFSRTIHTGRRALAASISIYSGSTTWLKLSTAGASQRIEDVFGREPLMPYLGSEQLQGVINGNAPPARNL
jgi:hypothetical protein